MSNSAPDTAPAALAFAPHALTPEQVGERLHCGLDGLTAPEAARRLEEFGANSLPQPGAPGLAQVLLRQFLNPLIYVLMIAAGVALFLGESLDAGFIAGVLVLNAVIGAIQEWHAQRSADALQKLAVASCQVVRDGEVHVIDASELVPGDLVLLESGMRVPADLRLVSSHGLEIDESLLTGESLPTPGNAKSLLSPETVPGDRENMAHAGTMVTRGRATGLVVATGSVTLVGQLALSLGTIESAEAPLLARMRRFTMRLMVALAVLVAIIMAVEMARGAPLASILMLGIALAVSTVPEGLPIAVTVALAIGMSRMARRNVIVRRLVAVESLGSCDIIASDKTGTLTRNRMTARGLLLPWGEQWRASGDDETTTGQLTPAYPDGELSHRGAVDRLCLAAALCNEGQLRMEGDRWIKQGDAMDVALLVLAHKAGFPIGTLRTRYPLEDQQPYEPALGFAATLHRQGDGWLLVVKGAAEKIQAMCTTMQTPENQRPIDTDQITAQVDGMADQGYRVLAHAWTQLDEAPKPGTLPLEELCFLGLTGMIDPVREEAIPAVRDCLGAGIRVLMVTGDHPRTALAIARELGIARQQGEVLTGAEMRRLAQGPTEARRDAILGANVFARVEPSQKLEIIQALAEAGHNVAVTGDGVNDAPALSRAHVGVAMGKHGTDVARESADIVLADDNFASVVAGVEEGRVAYQNIRKVIFLLISTGMAELFLFILSIAAGMPVPLTALQLLWLNLVTNGIQDVALAFEPAEGDEMQRPPRPVREAIFNRLMLERILVSALLMGSSCFVLFHTLLAAGLDEVMARNQVLLLMVLFENVQVFNSRSETRSVFRQRFNNRLLILGTLAAQAIHVGAMFTPGLSGILEIAPVAPGDWLPLVAVALMLLIAMEAHTFSWHRRFGHNRFVQSVHH